MKLTIASENYVPFQAYAEVLAADFLLRVELGCVGITTPGRSNQGPQPI